jgi:hypothetical protein
MRIWQAPGEAKKAEWLAASDDPDWRVKGGSWYKRALPNEPNLVYVVIVVRDTEGWNAVSEPFYAYAKQVDLHRVTLPEVKDLLPEDLEGKVPDRLGSVPVLLASLFPGDWEKRILRAAARRGFGLVLGGRAGKTARHVRSEAKKMVEQYLGDKQYEEGLVAAKIAPNQKSAGAAIRSSRAWLHQVFDNSVHHRRWGQLRQREPIEYMAGFISGMQKRDSGEDETEEYLAGWRHGWEYAVGKAALPRWFTQKMPNGTEGH